MRIKNRFFSVLLLILIIIFSVGFHGKLISRNITVNSVEFTETIDNKFKSEFPLVKAGTSQDSSIVNKINKAIKDRFMIDSFDPKKTTEFRWYDVDFNSEIKSGILLISFNGKYYGSYLSNVSDNLYFDLKTGDQLNEKLLKLCDLFSLDGYYAFLEKYWVPGCNTQLDSAKICAGVTPQCNSYDVDFSLTKSKIDLSLISECFPHSIQNCSPKYNISISLDSLTPYLNSFGKNVLFKTNYYKMSRLERYLFYLDNLQKISDNLQISGNLLSQGNFNMMITLDIKTHKVRGYYNLENYQNVIQLNGSFDWKCIRLNEQRSDKEGGNFEIYWTNNIDFITKYHNSNGSWTGYLTDNSGKKIIMRILSVKENK